MMMIHKARSLNPMLMFCLLGCLANTVIVVTASNTSTSGLRPVRLLGAEIPRNGAPLVGESIVVKESIVGVVRDLVGNFGSQVNPGDVLQISRVGHTARMFTIGRERVLNRVPEKDKKNGCVAEAPLFMLVGRRGASSSRDSPWKELFIESRSKFQTKTWAGVNSSDFETIKNRLKLWD
jgi:hypothetical protein